MLQLDTSFHDDVAGEINTQTVTVDHY